jgi:predicted SAM-dependent methyltransferase
MLILWAGNVTNMKLNLGCGNDIRSGYINIDVRKTRADVLQVDLEKEFLRFIPDESVDELLLKDFLEHLSWRVVENFLKDCFRVLKKGGKIIIQVPDIEAIVQQVVQNPNYKFGDLEGFKAISYWIYGAQDYPENTHKSGFTRLTLKKLLEQIGFSIVKLETVGTNILCEVTKS